MIMTVMTDDEGDDDEQYNIRKGVKMIISF